MRSIPQQCAEARADFIDRAMHPSHVMFMEGMVQSSRRAGDKLFPYDWDAHQVVHDMQYTMGMAEMFTATPDMFRLIDHASKSMPPETLERMDLPSQNGFLFLPETLRIEDVRGGMLPIKAIMWSEREIGRNGESPGGRDLPHVQRGVVLWLFTENGGKEDPLWERHSAADVHRVLRDSPEMSLMHATSIGFGVQAWSVDTSRMEGVPPEIRARVGRDAMRSAHDVVSEELNDDGTWTVTTSKGYVVRAIPERTLQFIKAYFHMVASNLTDLDREFPPRSSARMLRRLGMPDAPITVVRLRRRPHGAESGNGFSLTYRYVRRGHWRKQWYGSGDDRFQRSIFILPTIVGPEDGELRVRDVVNLVQR